MAGSWSHVTNHDGSFAGIDLIDNLGDAHEALEEMHGIIMVLAEGSLPAIEHAVEVARTQRINRRKNS